MPTVPPRLVIRADGGPVLGVGHLARSLALAKVWIDRRGTAALASEDPPAFWTRRFEAIGCSVVAPADVANEADWWAVDGYHLRGAASAPDGMRTLVIDDHDTAGTRGIGATLVVDQNAFVGAADYPGADLALTGPRYALVPPASLQSSENTRHSEHKQVAVILGGAPSPEMVELGEALERDPRLEHFQVHFLRGTDDVATALLTADIAVATASTISWELCRAGVPAVLLTAAENQQPVARALDGLGAAVHVTASVDAIVSTVQALAADDARRARMSSAGRTLVDGLGARRVVTRMRSALISLRAATMDDARAILDWSNDPATRAASFSSAPISWSEHQAWLANRLVRTDAVVYVGNDQCGEDVGMVRFHASENGVAEIGVVIAPERRRQGWASGLIDAGVARWHRAHPDDRIDAWIKAGNAASVRAFVDADFDADLAEDDGSLRYARRPYEHRR